MGREENYRDFRRCFLLKLVNQTSFESKKKTFSALPLNLQTKYKTGFFESLESVNGCIWKRLIYLNTNFAYIDYAEIAFLLIYIHIQQFKRILEWLPETIDHIVRCFCELINRVS